MSRFRSLVLAISLGACGDDLAGSIDRTEACAEEAAAWCEAVDAATGATCGAAAEEWYVGRCGGSEPIAIADHDTCMSALAEFEISTSGPLVPLECIALWP